MKIAAHDGATLALTVLGYEFATNEGSGPDDDWLVVEGRVGLADGRRWTFRSPCLTVGEAEELARWLRRPEGLCAFAEPLLALRSTTDGVEVQFSHESLPSWMRPGGVHAWLGLTVDLQLSLADASGDDLQVTLDAAADQWAKALAPFPARPVVEREPGEAERLLLAAHR